MIKFSTYLREKKVSLINQFREDFLRDFKVDLGYGKGFTRSDFFHFAEYDNKKYVHKKALEFCLTNGNSYYFGEKELDSFEVNSDEKEVLKIKENVRNIFTFFKDEINNYEIYPKFLFESEHFLVFEYYGEEEWEFVVDLTKRDADFIFNSFNNASKDKRIIITPFYNQMFNKILRHKKSGNIKVVDLKSFEVHDKGPLGILFYNGIMNNYYLLEKRYVFKNMILKKFSNDYPVRRTKMVKLYR